MDACVRLRLHRGLTRPAAADAGDDSNWIARWGAAWSGHAPLATSAPTPTPLHSSSRIAPRARVRARIPEASPQPQPLPACGYTIQRATEATEIAAAPPVSTSPLELSQPGAQPRDN